MSMSLYVLLVMRIYVLLVMRIRSVMRMSMPTRSMMVPHMVVPTVNCVPVIITILNVM